MGGFDSAHGGWDSPEPFVTGSDGIFNAVTVKDRNGLNPNTATLPGTGGGGQLALTPTPNGVDTGKIWDWGGKLWDVQAAGGVGNGATSDDVAISAASTAAAGGCAEFPGPRTYMFAYLAPANSQQVAGTSRAGSVLKLINGTNPVFAINVGANGTHIHLRDLTFDGNASNNPTANTGILLSAANCSVENIRTQNTNGRGISVTSSGNAVLNSHVESSGAFSDGAIWFGNASMFRIIGNRIDTPLTHGMIFQPGSPSTLGTILGNTVLNSGAAYQGIAYGGTGAAALLTLTANVVSELTTGNHCIDVGAAVDIAVIGNIFSGGSFGTSVDGAQRLAYVGNVIRNPAGHGIEPANSSPPINTGQLSGRDEVVGCNVFSDCGQAAVDVDSTSYLVVIGNVGKGSKPPGAASAAFDIHRNQLAMTNRILLIGNIGYDDKVVKTQLYGMRTTAGVLGSVVAAHNDFRGNLTGAVLDGAGDTYMHGNTGYNPRGGLTPPGIPATTVLFQNPFNVDCTVYIKGGTLTDITIGGLPVPSTWGAQPTTATATTGGTLAPGTYYYRCAARNPAGHTIECVEFSQVVPGGTSTNTVTITFPALRGHTGWDVYGRSTGAELLMAANWQMGSFIDDGSITPSGAMPGTDTTDHTATGISAAASAGAVHTVRVLYGQCIKLTYSVAPTWTWFGD